MLEVKEAALMGQGGERFLKDFFSAEGKHPNPGKAYDHFANAFVRPQDEHFEQFVADLTPVEGRKKVVVVDGHPRSGKTWVTAAALASVIDKIALPADQWWTGGFDSMSIYGSRNDTIHDACQNVLKKLREKQGSKIVFLDDFLGTNALRLLGVTEKEKKAASTFFRWDDNNPLLRELPLGCTIVITVRSIFLTLTEILLNQKIRPRHTREESHGLVVLNYRRGIFQSNLGEISGAFSREQLLAACDTNLKHHPLAADRERLLRAAPLIAFKFLSQRDGLTKSEKQIAANVFFGDDLRSIRETVERYEFSSDERDARIGERLDMAYLLSIAPGLLYLGPSAYASLGIDETLARELLDDLYLEETVRDVKAGNSRVALLRSGRLPNELYPLALQLHLQPHMPLVERVFTRVIRRQETEQQDGPTVGDSRTVGIGLRGIIERYLNDDEGSNDHDLSVAERWGHDPAWQDLLQEYLNKHKEPLLRWEYTVKKNSSVPRGQVPQSPGFAAALGWASYYFGSQKKTIEEGACRSIIEWYLKDFSKQQKRLKQGRKSTPAKGVGLREDDVVANYSTILQWIIKAEMERFEAAGEEAPHSHEADQDCVLDLVLNCGTSEEESVRLALEIVKEDELLWASTLALPDDGDYSAVREFRRLPPVRRLIDTIEADCKPDAASPLELRVNRFFSISWHNEWRRLPHDRVYKIASRWNHTHGDTVLQALSEDPGLLDANLTYHWDHFITQHATWMRHWCFRHDPFEYQMQRISRGSTAPDHNADLCKIAARVITKDCEAKRFRNMLLLIGSRVETMPGAEMGELLGRIPDLVRDSDNCDELKGAVLQSIFELSRQGFLESRIASGSFINWCVDRVREYDARIDDAWQMYHRELERVTYLDPLPSHWKHVRPEGWPD